MLDRGSASHVCCQAGPATPGRRRPITGNSWKRCYGLHLLVRRALACTRGPETGPHCSGASDTGRRSVLWGGPSGAYWRVQMLGTPLWMAWPPLSTARRRGASAGSTSGHRPVLRRDGNEDRGAHQCPGSFATLPLAAVSLQGQPVSSTVDRRTCLPPIARRQGLCQRLDTRRPFGPGGNSRDPANIERHARDQQSQDNVRMAYLVQGFFPDFKRFRQIAAQWDKTGQATRR